MTEAAPALRLRPARAGDEAAIRDCAALAYARYTPLIGRAPAPVSADFAAQIAAGQVHVAEDGRGAVLGYVTCFPEAGAMLLESVAVLPEAAGRGIGRALIALCEARARAAGLGRVRLYTNAKMTANLALYPRLGYVETGRGRADGFDRVWFEKVL